jgi:hypothetical protein
MGVAARPLSLGWIPLAVVMAFCLTCLLVYGRVQRLIFTRIDMAGELLQQWFIALFVVGIVAAMLTGRPNWLAGSAASVLFFLLALPLSNARFAIFSGLLHDLLVTGVPEEFIMRRRLLRKKRAASEAEAGEHKVRRVRIRHRKLLRALAVGHVVIPETSEIDPPAAASEPPQRPARAEPSQGHCGLARRLLGKAIRVGLVLLLIAAGIFVWQLKRTTPRSAAASVVPRAAGGLAAKPVAAKPPNQSTSSASGATRPRGASH